MKLLCRVGMVCALLVFGACSRDDAPHPAQDMDLMTSQEMGEGDASSDLSEDIGGALDAPADLAEQDGDMSADLAPDMGEVVRDGERFASAQEIFEAVNPFIGTGGLGFGFSALTPAAQLPLGLVKLGPDTTQGGNHTHNQHMGGYNFADAHVRGFSHLHFVGTGVADYGNVRVLPTRTLDGVGTARLYATQERSQEDAEPGYYTITLQEPGVRAELTATTRAGVHRYRFDEGGTRERPAYLTIDLASSVRDAGVEDLSLAIDPQSGKLTGWVRYRGGYVGRSRPFTLHVVGEVSPAPTRSFVWGESGIDEAAQQVSEGGTRGGVVYAWEGEEREVELRLGLSLVDEAGAARNLAEEAPWSLDFEALRQRAREAWLDKLERVRVAGGTVSEMNLFYTALYNAYRMPTRFDDRDGRYVGLDGEVHQSAHPYYTDLSLWDSYRTTHPLYTVIDEEVARDVLSSLLAMARDGGVLPRWPAATSYTGGMTGTSADVLFGEGAKKGIEGVDWSEALAAVMLTAEGPPPAGSPFGGRAGIEAYTMLGYVPAEESSGPAAVTLEYAFDDWAVANLAEVTGELEVASRFRERSKSYRHIFDPQTRFFRGKVRSGEWVEEFDPEVVEERSGANYVEGSAWHYRFYALHDPQGLRELFGGAQGLGEALEELFEKSKFGKGLLGRNVLPEPYYWHGNQPPLHSVSLFAYSDRPERQGYWIEQIRRRYYDETPAGLPGNDDGGTLSSWYVFHALGFYPVAGGAGYILGSPLFTRAEVKMKGGVLQITAPMAGPGHRVVREVRREGEVVSGPQVSHQELRGGALEFVLAP